MQKRRRKEKNRVDREPNGSHRQDQESVSGIDWREKRLTNKLYMDRSVKLKLDQGETRVVKTGRGVKEGRSLTSMLFKCAKEDLQDSGDLKI